MNTQLIARVETSGRNRDAGGAVQRRCGKIYAFAAQPVGILDRYRRVVDEDADRERHAAERHSVKRVAQAIRDDYRRQDRRRDRDQDDQGRPPRAKKQQDHQPGEPSGDRSLAQHARDRCGDKLPILYLCAKAVPGLFESVGFPAGSDRHNITLKKSAASSRTAASRCGASAPPLDTRARYA